MAHGGREGANPKAAAPDAMHSAPCALLHLPGGRIPDSLGAVAMKALARSQEDRYQSVKGLQHDVEAYQTGFATSVEQAGAWTQFTLLVKRNKGVFTAIAAALAIIVTGSVVFTVRVMTERNRAKTQWERAEQALDRFKKEQDRRQQDRKQSAPALVETARMLILNNDFATALSAVETACEYDPDLAPAQCLAAGLLCIQGEYKRALEHGQVYSALRQADPLAQRLAEACRSAVERGPASSPAGELSELFMRENVPGLAVKFSQSAKQNLPMYRNQIDKVWPGVGKALTPIGEGKLRLILQVREDVMDLRPLEGIPLSELNIDRTRVADLTPLKRMPLTYLYAPSTRIVDLVPLKGRPLTYLNLQNTKITDLSPLRGMSLLYLDAGNTEISDLSPLKGMPLTCLSVGHTHVADLSPLRDLPLTDLSVGATEVSDLSPLRGMPLKTLNVEDTKVGDLSPLKGMQLNHLRISPQHITNGWEVVREMKTLAQIQVYNASWTPTEFFKKLDAGEFKKK